MERLAVKVGARPSEMDRLLFAATLGHRGYATQRLHYQGGPAGYQKRRLAVGSTPDPRWETKQIRFALNLPRGTCRRLSMSNWTQETHGNDARGKPETKPRFSDPGALETAFAIPTFSTVRMRRFSVRQHTAITCAFRALATGLLLCGNLAWNPCVPGHSKLLSCSAT
jgi:hypothetical protein